MLGQRLIVVADLTLLALGAAMLTACTEESDRQAKPASGLMRDMNENQSSDWRSEPEPPQYESPPPEHFR